MTAEYNRESKPQALCCANFLAGVQQQFAQIDEVRMFLHAWQHTLAQDAMTEVNIKHNTP